MQREPVHQLFRLLALQFQHEWTHRRFFPGGDGRDDAYEGGLPVEQDAKSVPFHALQEQPSRRVPHVSVPELVVHLLQAADLGGAQHDSVFSLLDLVAAIAEYVACGCQDLVPVL
jgi:hypothetical protein